MKTPYEVPSHRLVKNGGMTFETGSNDPFTGTSIEYHLNAQLKEKTNFKNGKLDGLNEGFYENGQLQGRANYKNGELEGLLETFDENGQLKK